MKRPFRDAPVGRGPAAWLGQHHTELGVMNRVMPPIRTDDEAVRSSSSGPLPRVLTPVVLLSACPQRGGHAAGRPGRLDVKLAIEAAMDQYPSTRNARHLDIGRTAPT